MKETKQDVLNEMKETFRGDYEIMNRQANILRESNSIEDNTISIEDFRKAGIATINKFYGK